MEICLILDLKFPLNLLLECPSEAFKDGSPSDLQILFQVSSEIRLIESELLLFGHILFDRMGPKECALRNKNKIPLYSIIICNIWV